MAGSSSPVQAQTRLLLPNAYVHTVYITRTVSVALHTLQFGEPKIQSSHRLAIQRKLRPPKLKYEALEISEVGGHFERKVITHYSYYGPL